MKTLSIVVPQQRATRSLGEVFDQLLSEAEAIKDLLHDVHDVEVVLLDHQASALAPGLAAAHPGVRLLTRATESLGDTTPRADTTSADATPPVLIHVRDDANAAAQGADRIEVSVVIPCLNEARSLAACIDKARAAFLAAGVRGEVVVADNGSTDGSIAIAEQHGARVAHAEIKGYGNALKKGIEAARAEFIIMGDADDSYDFTDVPRFVAQWRAGHEVVMGNRFAGEIKPGAMPWHHRYVGNPILTGVLNLFFRSGIGDAHCGMRGFTKDVYRRMDLRTTGMEFASEFVIKAAKIGARMAEVPITLWPDRRGRPPHLRSFHDGWRHLRFMLLFAPNWLFLAPGGLLATLGVGLVLALLPGPAHLGGIELDIHTMLFGLVFGLLGVQISMIGLFVKVFSHSERFTRHNRSLERWLERVTLEQGLVAGAALTAVGLGGAGWLFWNWAASGFGAFAAMRWVIFWSLWLFLGVQVVFASFFLSMLGISRGTYIGDYDAQA